MSPIKLLWIFFLAIAAGAAATCLVIVDADEYAIVTQLGRPLATYDTPGLRFKWPAPFAQVKRIDKRLLATEAQPVEFLTADKKNVEVAWVAAWQVADPMQYWTALSHRAFAEARLAALIGSELGAALGELEFTQLVGVDGRRPGLAHLEERVQLACQAVAHRDFGIELKRFGVTRFNFPRQNQESVFARMRAERARIASAYRSEGEAEAQKIRAAADRQRAELLADAEAEATRIRGAGEAEAARIYAEAYTNDPEFYRFLRTLESYERVLDESTTLVLPADSPFLKLLTEHAWVDAGVTADTTARATPPPPAAPERWPATDEKVE